MSLLAGIETEVASRAEPDMGPAFEAAKGKAQLQSQALQGGGFRPSQPAPASFLANWQAQLASLAESAPTQAAPRQDEGSNAANTLPAEPRPAFSGILQSVAQPSPTQALVSSLQRKQPTSPDAAQKTSRPAPTVLTASVPSGERNSVSRQPAAKDSSPPNGGTSKTLARTRPSNSAPVPNAEGNPRSEEAAAQVGVASPPAPASAPSNPSLASAPAAFSPASTPPADAHSKQFHLPLEPNIGASLAAPSALPPPSGHPDPQPRAAVLSVPAESGVPDRSAETVHVPQAPTPAPAAPAAYENQTPVSISAGPLQAYSESPHQIGVQEQAGIESGAGVQKQTVMQSVASLQPPKSTIENAESPAAEPIGREASSIPETPSARALPSASSPQTESFSSAPIQATLHAPSAQAASSSSWPFESSQASSVSPTESAGPRHQAASLSSPNPPVPSRTGFESEPTAGPQSMARIPVPGPTHSQDAAGPMISAEPPFEGNLTQTPAASSPAPRSLFAAAPAHISPAGSAPARTPAPAAPAAAPGKSNPTPSNGNPAASDSTVADETDPQLAREQISLSAPPAVGAIKLEPAPVQFAMQGLVRPSLQNPAQTTGKTSERRPFSASDKPTDRSMEAGPGSSPESVPAKVGNSTPSSAIRPALQTDAHTPRESTSTGTPAHTLPSPSLQPQTGTPAREASTLALDPNSRSSRDAAAPTSSSTGPNSQNAFAALDANPRPEAPNWVHAGAHRAEAGFQDPALGWVGVQANSSAGQIHATLTPGSSDAAEALGGHMAGLHAYLADIHTPVDTLTLAAPEAREAALSTGYGQGSGTNQGMHQNADQGVPSQSPLNPLRDSPRAEEDFTESIPGLSPAVAAGASSSESTGTHISVMA